ncbi:MAG: phosphate uptake regulator PhoU [Nanoarchaeota archaeon]
MDYRKLIKFGENSFVISLPKMWLKKNQLEKGNVVYLTENGNNELMVSPQEHNNSQGERSIILDLDQEDDFQSILRKLYSKYIAGYDLITLLGEKAIREHGEKIRALLNELLAFEILEETKNKIVLKDYIDARIVSLEATIRRIDVLIRSMLDDLQHVYKDNTASLGRRDKEIGKLSLLALRILNKATINPQIQSKIGIKSDRLLNTWNLFNNFEPLASELKKLAIYLEKNNATKHELEAFFNLFERVSEDYKNAMKAWYTKDEKLAYATANAVLPRIEQCDMLIGVQKDIYLPLAISKLKNIETFIKNIVRGIYDV